MCHCFRFEQEPIFEYKPSDFIHDGDTGLLVVIYTERVVLVCTALLFSTYYEYCLWNVWPDIIHFAHELGMAMRLPLGSRVTVHKVLEMLEIIDLTRFEDLPDVWRDRTF